LYLDAGKPASYPGSGNTWTDTINNVAFTLNNGPTYDSSNGGCISFSPSSGQYASSSTGPTMSTYTVEMWHYYTGNGASTEACLLTQRLNGNSPLAYIFGFNHGVSNYNLAIGFYNGTPPYFYNSPNGVTLSPNHWYHLVGTYNGSTFVVYVNGQQVSSGASNSTVQFNGTGALNLMANWNSNQGYFGGKLAVVRMYNSALNSTQINQNFSTERSRFGI
jgi:Concanavalin A-like lectin/glucanases superfamily